VSLSVPALTSGSRASAGVTTTLSCADLLGSGPVTSTITGTVTGTVTSGLFAGDTFVQNNTGPAVDVLTCTAGLGTVSSIYSLVTLEITSV
jgi:hypothetical protein